MTEKQNLIPDEWAWERLRIQRNKELLASDWTQLADSEVDKLAWANYRQGLRDLPEKTKNPHTVKFPEKPE
jgi:hypothetical protein